MSPIQAPGGRALAIFYRVAVGLALFSGFGQMPLYKRYYLTSLPGMAWAADFFTLSTLHYLAALALLFLWGWRLSLSGGGGWTWGPRSWWGWVLAACLALTGVAKSLSNMGFFLSPFYLMILDLAHLGSAMAFMVTGLVVLFTPAKKAAAAPYQP